MKSLRLILLIVLLVVLLVSCFTTSSGKLNTAKKDLKDFKKLDEHSEDNYKRMDVINGTIDNSINNIINPTLLDSKIITLYFYNPKNNKLSPETRQIINLPDIYFTEKIIEALIKGPVDAGLQPVIAPKTRINSLTQSENVLKVDLTSDFLESDNLLLARSALVNTITELNSYKYVNILVDGRELKDHEGNAVGLLSKTSNYYAQLAELEADKENKSKLKAITRELYFQDYRGTYLLPEVRNINNSNGNIVHAIVEEVIKGPVSSEEGKYPTIPKSVILKKK